MTMNVTPLDPQKRRRSKPATTPEAEAAARDGRPTIEITTELHQVVDQAIEALGADGEMFQRDGALVRVVRVAESEADALTLAGTPVVRPVQPATLAERLTQVATFAKRKKDELRQCMPSSPLVQAVAARGEYPTIRPIKGITEAPMLRPDGSMLDAPGYDSATGYVYLPGVGFPKVPEHPSQADARRALEELREVFADFPHKTDADRIVPIAAILTMLARAAILGSVPAIAFDATTRGSGKTLQADAVSVITTGRPVSKMSWPADEAELEKVLASYALRGAPFILFDNLSTPFGGGPLDKVLTAQGRVDLRVLGKSEVPSLPWFSVVAVNGNNIEIMGDTCRRTLVSRLESPLENPEDRQDFRHPNLLEWVTAERPRLVIAGLTILRAWVKADRPRLVSKQWGSFEAWTSIVPQALVFAGGVDPMLARTQEQTEDPERRALLAILEGWPRLAPSGITAKHAIEALYSADRLQRQAPPDGFDDLRDAIENLVSTPPGKAPSPRQFGTCLRKFRGRVVGGKRLIGHPDRNGIVLWRVEGAGCEGPCGAFPNPN